MSVKKWIKGILIGAIAAVVAFFAILVGKKGTKEAATNNAAIKFANSTEEFVLKHFKGEVKNEVKKINKMKKEEVDAEFKRRFGN
jgi:hypothetical protein